MPKNQAENMCYRFCAMRSSHAQYELNRHCVWLHKILYSLLWLIALALVGTAQAKEQAIRVVLDDNYPPYIFRDPEGRPQGIVRDLWTLWEQRTGIRVEFKPMVWKDAQAEILGKRADVIDTIFKTEARLALYNYSAPYATIDVGLFFHHSLSSISDLKSLKGYLVGVPAGDACVDFLQKAGVTDFKLYRNNEDLVMAALRSEVRVFCMDTPPAVFILERENALQEFRSIRPLFVGQLHRAVLKGNEQLLQQIDDGFSKISPQEKQLIERRWLGAEPGPAVPEWMIRYGMVFAVTIILVSVVLVVWNRLLNMRVSEITADLQQSSSQLIQRVDELEHARLKLQESQSLLQTLIRSIPYPVWMKDKLGRYQFCNSAFLQFYGVGEAELIGRASSEFMEEEDSREHESADKIAINQNFPYLYEAWVEDRSIGKRRLMEITKTAVVTPRGELLGSIGISHDVTERRAYEEQLERMAHHDVLTGLPNRLLLTDRLRLSLAQEPRRGTNLAVVYLDLDGFKEINDRHGHDIGDQLLIALAQRMKSVLRDGDTLARLGGDEFVALLCDMGDISSCQPWLQRLLEAASDFVLIQGNTLRVSASLGVTFYPQSEPVDADQLLRQADQAMYQAKILGKNRYFIFDADPLLSG